MNKATLKVLVEKHAASAQGDGAAAVQSLFDVLEPLVEDAGMQARFSSAVVEHLEEKNKEIKSFRFARNVLLIISMIIIVSVMGIFYYLLIVPTNATAFVALGNAKIAFVSATFISGFGLLAIILRGVFHASDREDTGGPMVESIKTLLQLTKEVVK